MLKVRNKEKIMLTFCTTFIHEEHSNITCMVRPYKRPNHPLLPSRYLSLLQNKNHLFFFSLPFLVAKIKTLCSFSLYPKPLPFLSFLLSNESTSKKPSFSPPFFWVPESPTKKQTPRKFLLPSPLFVCFPFQPSLWYPWPTSFSSFPPLFVGKLWGFGACLACRRREAGCSWRWCEKVWASWQGTGKANGGLERGGFK